VLDAREEAPKPRVDVKARVVAEFVVIELAIESGHRGVGGVVLRG
jgi:hypothetical protein